MGKKRRVTYEEKKTVVLERLKEKEGWTSPSEIGGWFGGHSAIGSPLCLKMRNEGLLERNDNGHYRLSKK